MKKPLISKSDPYVVVRWKGHDQYGLVIQNGQEVNRFKFPQEEALIQALIPQLMVSTSKVIKWVYEPPKRIYKLVTI